MTYKLKLITLITIIMSSTIMYAHRSHKQSTISHFIVNTILAKKFRSLQSNGAASIDFVQITNSNKFQMILNKLRAQQIALLAALSQNNDDLLRALKDPLSTLDTQTLLATSREILALSTDMDRYLNSKSV